MKTSLFLVSLFFVTLVSCHKEKTEAHTDPRDGHAGTYNCLLRSKQLFYDSLNHAYIYDTSYSTVVEVKKSSTSGNLVINGLEVTMSDDTHFDAPRFMGYFFGEDSLYIDNSHPTHVMYTNIYKGKKVKQ
ncbi:hypothetical protein CNR22_14555 [Sphingobacteriaceae bacterium]|nr:hypothetical protein CNR22_14555 [Sphingobacteriaceae bacterium]